MFARLPNDWKAELPSEWQQSNEIKDLNKFIETEYANYVIYPKHEDIFKAFEYTSFNSLKAVILGQDPYHNPNQAHGLAFSVKNGKNPPSLKNIFEELWTDIGVKRENGNLSDWAKQGVLLLNTSLTVREKQPNSHKLGGWGVFTDLILKTISENKKNVVFILWGSNAQAKESLIDKQNHLIIKSSHPSPFSVYRGFFGSKPFSKTNEYLIAHNKEPIIW